MVSGTVRLESVPLVKDSTEDSSTQLHQRSRMLQRLSSAACAARECAYTRGTGRLV